MKKDNVLLFAAGIAGAALGYFVGKKYGDSISEKVNENYCPLTSDWICGC